MHVACSSIPSTNYQFMLGFDLTTHHLEEWIGAVVVKPLLITKIQKCSISLSNFNITRPHSQWPAQINSRSMSNDQEHAPIPTVYRFDFDYSSSVL